MTIEGIWTGEIYGPYGWEQIGVYVIEQGLMLGGNNRHYSVGRYSLSGKAFEAEILNYYYGPPRTIFGEKRERFEIKLTGRLEAEVIDGKIVRADRPRFDVVCQLTKRLDLPGRAPASRAV
ncbi:MAG: hypothetical protein QNJ30_19585 [Kiloniellales bacterium]|nr:hypothetical protein [Kiloniellales bacterium]